MLPERRQDAFRRLTGELLDVCCTEPDLGVRLGEECGLISAGSEKRWVMVPPSVRTGMWCRRSRAVTSGSS